MADINPWHPMTDAVDIKHLGKLAEELGELTAAVSRCLIQGITELEPVTGKSNTLWLEEEIADVFTGCLLVMEHFQLDKQFINARIARKQAGLKKWHELA